MGDAGGDGAATNEAAGGASGKEAGVARAAQQFVIGDTVVCSDGTCGELRRVVVNPISHKLTHLVVQPTVSKNELEARLVPVTLVASAAGGSIELSCDQEAFGDLDRAEEEQFISEPPGEWGYEQGQVMAFPWYGLAPTGMGMNPGIGAVGMIAPGMGSDEPAVIEDRIPLGEVEVRRGADVYASDGKIGRVEGLVVDPSDDRVTHVLLQEGHLWGKKDVAVPISAVGEVIDDEVRLSLTKDQVRDLPPIELDRRR
jgi:sporulation protein YlmC with PRC-barrel domain